MPPEERAETPQCPSIVIPFSRDPDFVDRGTTVDQGTLIDHVIQKCRRPGSRTALVGLGGVGKSQLAIEYAYRIREQSPETWVFWIHASNPARFEQSIRDIADCAKMYRRQNPRVIIVLSNISTTALGAAGTFGPLYVADGVPDGCGGHRS